jgi:hypothetical protein
MLLETKTKFRELLLSLFPFSLLHQHQPTFIKDITKTHMQVGIHGP